MITLRRRTWIEQIRYTLFPAYRRKCDARLQAGIERLMEQPWLPCDVGGVVIPNGYGPNPPNVGTPFPLPLHTLSRYGDPPNAHER